jgi:hypothetical protein
VEARSGHRPERERHSAQHSAQQERLEGAELSDPARHAPMAAMARLREEAKLEVRPAAVLQEAERLLPAATALCRSDLAKAWKGQLEFVERPPVENPAAIASRRKGAAARRTARLAAQAAQEVLRSAVPMTSADQVAAEQAAAEPTEGWAEAAVPQPEVAEV